MPGLDLTWGSVTKYLKQHVAKSTENHRPFLKGIAKYTRDHNANPLGTRLHSRKELENLKTVTTKKTTGSRRIKPRRQFVELWKWKLQNPDKSWDDEGLAMIECPMPVFSCVSMLSLYVSLPCILSNDSITLHLPGKKSMEK